MPEAGAIWKKYMETTSGGKEKFSVPETIKKNYVDGRGYPTSVKTSKKDLFAVEIKKTAEEEKNSYYLKQQKAAADKAVKAFEDFHIDSLDDYYVGYDSLKKAAEDKGTECGVFCFAHQEKSTLPGVPKGTG